MTLESIRQDVRVALSSGLAFIEQCGVETFDPLDVSTHPATQRLLIVRSRSGSIFRKLFWAGSYFAPRWNRRCLGIQPAAMHSGVANLASAYLEVGGAANLEKARKWLTWLESTSFNFSKYRGWGFPFPWKQKLLVLSGTPIGHTTMTCANVFLKFASLTGDESHFRMVRSACDFFHYGLKQSPRKDGAVALSYTPLDETHIINIQADIASLLLRFWSVGGEERDRELGLKLLRCVLQTQNQDGSWSYYAPDTTATSNYVDNHHTGMILSSLAEIEHANLLPDEISPCVRDALISGADYFLERLFLSDGTPKYYSDSLHPIEIYNFAQSIFTFLDLKAVLRADETRYRKVEERLNQVILRLLELMRKTDGGFLYRRMKWARQDLNSLRWANALTVAALGRWLRETEDCETKSGERISLQNA